MRRRAIQRVRTGCITCKVRKVKCDETRPHCVRCKSTGRKCDGYMTPPPGTYSWDELLQVRPSTTPDASTAELRSLAFFRQVVAPVLSGPLGRSFWTHLVAQVAHQESAARHAAVAISSLYERFGQDSESPSQSDNRFAIRHYNRAIQQIISLQSPKRDQLDSVLIVCILFTCIEFLQGNPEAAINHYRHGISLLGSYRPDAELLPIFRHLSIFPLHFSDTLSAFPLHSDADCPAVAGPFHTLAQAQEALDWLSYRAARLSRASDQLRASSGTAPPAPSPFILEQWQLDEDLEAWSSAVTKLRRLQFSGSEQKTIDYLLQARWLVYKIWVNACLDPGQAAYDTYLDQFEQIVEIARLAKLSEAPFSSTSRKFVFEMGFAPFLYFVVVKCRHLRIRLAALSLMRSMSYSREVLWDSTVMQAIGKKVIEIEHGIDLPVEEDFDSLAMTGAPVPILAGAQRVTEAEEIDVSVSDGDEPRKRSKICFHGPATGDADALEPKFSTMSFGSGDSNSSI